MIRPPRVPIGTLMLAVIFIALGLTLLRATERLMNDSSLREPLIGLIPATIVVADLLLFQVATRLPRLRRTGLDAASFLVGFQLATWGALGGLLVLGIVVGESLTWYAETCFRPIAPIARYLVSSPALVYPAEMGMAAVLFGGPVLAVGLIGGWLARRLGIVVEVRVGRVGRSASVAGAPVSMEDA